MNYLERDISDYVDLVKEERHLTLLRRQILDAIFQALE